MRAMNKIPKGRGFFLLWYNIPNNILKVSKNEVGTYVFNTYLKKE